MAKIHRFDWKDVYRVIKGTNDNYRESLATTQQFLACVDFICQAAYGQLRGSLALGWDPQDMQFKYGMSNVFTAFFDMLVDAEYGLLRAMMIFPNYEKREMLRLIRQIFDELLNSMGGRVKIIDPPPNVTS